MTKMNEHARLSGLKKVGRVIAYVCGAAFTVLVVGIILLADVSFWENPVSIAGILLFLGILLTWNVIRCVRYLRKIRRAREEIAEEQWEETPENIRRSILYLRPFHTDSRYTAPVNYRGKIYTSVESLLHAVLNEKGKMVAIGKPGEKLQPLGAKRVYADDNEWKQKVLMYLKEAQYVLLYIDFTPGVLWEIQQSLDGYMDKVVLIPRVYNLKASLLRMPLLFDVLIFFYPLYKLFFETLWPRKMRRGWRFYRSWKRALGEKTKNIRMDDRVSAVIFENGEAVAFHTRNGSIEAQLDAIVHAVQAKVGENAKKALPAEACNERTEENAADRKKKEKKLRFNATLATKTKANGWLVPAGYIDFGEYGIRFEYHMMLMRMNFGMKMLYGYYRKELPYSSIVEIREEKGNGLMLCTDTLNLTLHLTLPAWHAGMRNDIRQMLERRGACGKERMETAEIERRLQETDRRSCRIAALLSLIAGVCSIFVPNLAIGLLLIVVAWYAASVSRKRLLSILMFLLIGFFIWVMTIG